MNGKNDKRSFWTTLPGILTGIASVITAIGTLYMVFYSGVGPFGPTPTPTPILTPPITPTVTPTPN